MSESELCSLVLHLKAVNFICPDVILQVCFFPYPVDVIFIKSKRSDVFQRNPLKADVRHIRETCNIIIGGSKLTKIIPPRYKNLTGLTGKLIF